ncbi:MAG: MlaD family protein [Armatimonadota bacterium]|nr:MlaD family protein [Armatimonadota bacterium]
MQSAWKVGLFVLVFAALLIGGYTIVGQSLFRKPTDTYYAIMEDVGSIDPGSKVTLAGVGIGTVRSIDLLGPKEVRLTFAIQKGMYIPKDIRFSSSTSLLSLSEEKVKLVSDLGEEAGRLPPGSTIYLKKGSLLSSVLPEGDALIKELTATVQATRELLSDPALKAGVTDLMKGTKTTLAALDKVLGQTQVLIAENRGTLKQVVVGAAAAVDEMRSGIRSVMAQVKDADLPANVKNILASLERTAARAETLVTDMNAFANDPAMRTAMMNTVANMEEVSRRGVDIAENTRLMSEDGKVITSKAIGLADQAQDIAAEAKVLLEKLSSFLGVLPSGGTKLARPELTLETGRNLDDARFSTNAFLDYPLSPTTSIFGGIYDVTETNLLTMQYGQKFSSSNRLRYGVYASKPGIGVDYTPTSRMSFSGDLFDPNDLKFNVRARYIISNGVYGWLGVDRLFDGNHALIGIGVKR